MSYRDTLLPCEKNDIDKLLDRRQVNNTVEFLVQNGAKILSVDNIAAHLLLKTGEKATIFRDTRDTQEMFYQDNMYSFYGKCYKELNYDSFILPSYLLESNKGSISDLVGYVSAWHQGKTLNKLPDNMKISQLMEAYPYLMEDIEKASRKNFKIYAFNHHILFADNRFYLFNPEYGWEFVSTDDYETRIFYNRERIKEVILKSLFKMSKSAHIEFKDEKLEEMYRVTYYKEPERLPELLEMINERIDSDEPTVRDYKNNTKLLKRVFYNE